VVRFCKDHPLATPFGVALAVRLIASIVAIAGVHGYLIPDEVQYVELGGVAAAGHLGPHFWSGYGESLFHEAASFMWPLTVLFWLFGAHVVLAAAWAAIFGALTAALAALLVSRMASRGWAVAAGLVVALFPSQVLWSSVVLRESMVWATLAAIAYGIWLLAGAKGWASLSTGMAFVAVPLLTVAFLRVWVFLAAAWAVALAVWLFRPARPVIVRGFCVLIMVLMPLLPGLGLAGADYVHKSGGNLGYERTVLSIGAKSAIGHPKIIHTPVANPKTVHTPATKPPTTKPPSGHPTTTTTAATTTTTQSGTSIIPAGGPDAYYLAHNGLGSDLRALTPGLIAFLLRPFPWQHGGGVGLDLAAVEEFLYYPLYVLAIVGLVAYRKRRDMLAFPFLVTGFIAGIGALVEGNVGSAFRHRDQFLWAVVLFATLGTRYLYERWKARRTGTARNAAEEEALSRNSPGSLGHRPVTVNQAGR
jgi:hypothetical protein